MMIMNLTCPECGNKFEIEESHQAKERQAAALKEQKEEAEKETQRLLAEQKQQLAKEIKESHQAKERQATALKEQKEETEKETQRLLAEQKQQLAKEQDSIVEAAVQKQVEQELNESRKRLQDEAKEEAEKETQRLLAEQKQQLAKEQDSIVEAEVQKQVEEKQAAALKVQQENLQQQAQQMLAKKDRESEEALIRKDSQHKLEKNRLAAQVNELQARIKRDQAVELVGEAAEERLKEALRQRFPDDTILDVPKGKQGADLEQHVTLKGSGKSIGMILIERKSTKAFLKTWIPKLKKEVENSGAKIGVIVTDVMPKIHKDKSYFPESSTISVLRADVAVDHIEIIRENMIKNYREEVAERATQDIELTANVFAYITGAGSKYLEDFQGKLIERKELLNTRDADHKRIMKKEWKNWEDQVDAYQKLGEGLKEASNEKVNVLGTTIKIEGPKEYGL